MRLCAQEDSDYQVCCELFGVDPCAEQAEVERILAKRRALHDVEGKFKGESEAFREAQREMIRDAEYRYQVIKGYRAKRA